MPDTIDDISRLSISR